ncbi:E3 ubiquitin-protein ligase UPL6 [Camellia lanceoleosa]|uniref:E3 ubiquitin-protein ligase UPL6 n=1 Tax=Camellia lanceoleosa TaxID=1840588 RepID=A0ACC0H367_9ERIC|nr:E3 ubiquitin-protein ligase UPL6 [Camellia lanceoleosa]
MDDLIKKEDPPPSPPHSRRMFTTKSRSTTIYSTVAELHMDDFRRVSGCAWLSYVGMVRLSMLRLHDADGGVAEDNGRRQRRWQFKSKIDEREREKIESLFSLYQCMSFSDECSQIRVTFVNGFGVVEAGIDGGGIFKYFMENITQAAFNVQYGLFKTLKFDAKFEGNLMLIELGFFVKGDSEDLYDFF